MAGTTVKAKNGWVFRARRDGKTINWTTCPEFAEWFRANAALLTTPELTKAMAELTELPIPGPSSLAHLRGALGTRQSKETWRRAHDSAPIPTTLRTLGPGDEDFFVKVDGDCLVTSDWHIPYFHEDLAEKLFAVRKALGIKQLVINGDFLNEDAFSRWKGHPFNMPWATEKAMAQELLARLCGEFERIYYVLDNHDRRIMWMHEKPGEFTEHDFLAILTKGITAGKVRASIYYHYVIVNGLWRITSPKEYRRTKLTLSNRLAQLHHQHIIVGGDHLFGLGLDDSGKYVIASNLCMVNPAEVPYSNTQDTTFPHWNPGFYLIRDNVLTPFPWHPNLWPTWWEKNGKGKR